MDSILVFQKNLQEFGYNVYIISEPSWKFESFKTIFKPNSIMIFDTGLVGCGEFGEKYPSEVAKEKWKDAYGILQCVSSFDNKCEMMVSVMPKFLYDDKQSMKMFLKQKHKCDICEKVESHVKICHLSKSAVCISCYENILKRDCCCVNSRSEPCRVAATEQYNDKWYCWRHDPKAKF